MSTDVALPAPQFLPHVNGKASGETTATPERPDPNDPEVLYAKRLAFHRADLKAKQTVAEEEAERQAKAATAAGAERSEAVDAMRARLLDRKALHQLPPAKYLIKGVLDFDSETWLIGASGGFKSFMAIDWACHVALGRMWWGRRIRQGKVLYIVGEGVRGIDRRITAWEIANQVEVNDLWIHPGPVQVRAAGERDAISFDWNTLCQLASQEQPALIILDTQARMTVGLEENSNTSMGVWIEGVRLLREATGACVLVVHHTGRNGLDARGASALDGAQDTEWKVTRTGDKAKRMAKLKCEKHKDGDDDQAFDFQAHVVEIDRDEDGDPITSLTLRPMSAEMAAYVRDESTVQDLEEVVYDHDVDLSEKQTEVAIVVRERGAQQGLTKSEVRGLVDDLRKQRGAEPMHRNTVYECLKKLVERDVVTIIGSRYFDKKLLDEALVAASEAKAAA